MTGEQIRKRINADPAHKKTLECFEHCICEVDVYRNSSGYYNLMRKGAEGFADDAFTTLPMRNMESLTAFMQGALWYRLHGKEIENEKDIQHNAE